MEPTVEELAHQLGVELRAARVHLRAIVDRYWDRDWRDANHHFTSPEDQLWRAATAVSEIESAIEQLAT